MIRFKRYSRLVIAHADGSLVPEVESVPFDAASVGEFTLVPEGLTFYEALTMTNKWNELEARHAALNNQSPRFMYWI